MKSSTKNNDGCPESNNQPKKNMNMYIKIKGRLDYTDYLKYNKLYSKHQMMLGMTYFEACMFEREKHIA